METITGFIYYLQNPITDEIFYIGATECSLKNRLRTHYQHLSEYKKGLRKTNRRYEYLLQMNQTKATIHLLELVTNKNDLISKEIFYIKHFRKINPYLTNMTDGGRGNCTNKYYTEKEFEEYSKKLSVVNKGKPKPDGFGENLSIMRKGFGNPATKELERWIVCGTEEKPLQLFKYGFQINEYIHNKYAFGNVCSYLKRKGNLCYGLKWKFFDECNNEIQDIVHSAYESKQ